MGVEQLFALKTLKHIALPDECLTEEQFRRFKEALPECKADIISMMWPEID